jgi:hypothetical protein
MQNLVTMLLPSIDLGALASDITNLVMDKKTILSKVIDAKKAKVTVLKELIPKCFNKCCD